MICYTKFVRLRRWRSFVGQHSQHREYTGLIFFFVFLVRDCFFPILSLESMHNVHREGCTPLLRRFRCVLTQIEGILHMPASHMTPPPPPPGC